MTKEPKKPAKPAKKAAAATVKKRAAFKLPAVGSQINHALLMTEFVDDVRAVMKSDWPASNAPDVQVNTYPVDLIGQCVGSSPIPKYISQMTISSEGLSKQCQEPAAGTREWVFVRL